MIRGVPPVLLSWRLQNNLCNPRITNLGAPLFWGARVTYMTWVFVPVMFDLQIWWVKVLHGL